MTDYIKLRLKPQELGAVSILGLAHVGDAVYELMVRTWLCSRGLLTAKKLHSNAVTYVSAKSQAEAVKRLLPCLSDVELSVFQRGRNSRVNTIPRGATFEEYHMATGLEALIGHLYLSGEIERLNQLFATIIGE